MRDAFVAIASNATAQFSVTDPHSRDYFHTARDNAERLVRSLRAELRAGEERARRDTGGMHTVECADGSTEQVTGDELEAAAVILDGKRSRARRSSPAPAVVRNDRTGTVDGKSYDAWMRAVDAAVSGICGLSVHDLADFRSRDMFEDGCTAREAAEHALEESGYDLAMLD
ncbi:MAG: hypothetical protein HN396_04655 [Gemmatimonadales bacterium]|nr:hypothetical protein [Gemmatimonadales bacterium]